MLVFNGTIARCSASPRQRMPLRRTRPRPWRRRATPRPRALLARGLQKSSPRHPSPPTSSRRIAALLNSRVANHPKTPDRQGSSLASESTGTSNTPICFPSLPLASPRTSTSRSIPPMRRLRPSQKRLAGVPSPARSLSSKPETRCVRIDAVVHPSRRNASC